VGLLVGTFGCGEKKATDADKTAATEKAPAAKTDKPNAPATPPVKQEKLSAAHVLVMHKDSERAPKDITRTKEEALARAKEALAKIQGGADFGEVAKEFSDCPTKARGGDLGTFPPQAMAPAFTEGVKALKVGEVSSSPVETKFGYHIIKRQEVIEPVELSASLIVIMHKDSKPNPSKTTRTKEEALARAKEALAKIQSGADFGEVAKEFSDHPNGGQGGRMGNFLSDRVPAEMSKAIMSIEVGKITTEPLDMPLGYHIFKRTEPVKPEPVSAAVIIVTHKDSQPNPINATRTKKEALEIIKKAQAKLKAGTDFGEVAKEFSEHPSKIRGGDMGTMIAGRMPPDLLDAIMALKVGETTTEPLDLAIGYHLLKRQDPNKASAPGQMPPMPPMPKPSTKAPAPAPAPAPTPAPAK